MAVFSTPMGNPFQLTNIGALTESFSTPNWTYVGPNTPAGDDNTGIYPYTLAANRDGSVAVKANNINGLTIGFSASGNKAAGLIDYALVATAVGTPYSVKNGASNVTVTNSVNAAVGDIVQVRRAAKNIIAEVSSNNGTTWSTIYTWTNVANNIALYGFVMCPNTSSVTTVYATNIAPDTAYDDFNNLALNANIGGTSWDVGGLAWPTGTVERLKGKGNGYASRDVTVLSSVAAQYPMRNTDVGMAVFFKHDAGSDNLAPRLQIFGSATSTLTGYGVVLQVLNMAYPNTSRLSLIEYPTDGTTGNSTTISTSMQQNQDYCLEICRTDDPSNLVYNYRLMTVVNGVRTAIAGQGTFSTKAIATSTNASILGTANNSAMDSIRRVEALSVPFGIDDFSSASGPLIDNGTTVTAYIGFGADCHYANLFTWWNSVPASLVAANRSYIGLVDKTAEIRHDFVTLTAKTADATHTVTLKPRPGHAYFEHPNFLTNPLRYNAAVGAAFKFTGDTGNPCFWSKQDYMTVYGLQFQNPVDGGVTLRLDTTNTSLRLCIVDSPVANGNYTNIAYFGGLNSKHYGNLFSSGGKLAKGIEFGNQSVTFENCTFVSASDTGWAQGATNAALSAWNGITLINCAIFGFPGPMSAFWSSGVKMYSNASDTAFGPPVGTGTVSSNNQSSLVFADQFVSTTKANPDYRIKNGSLLYNAGQTPSAANNVSMNGSRVIEGAADIGAWESSRFTPTKLIVTSSKATITAGGYTATLTVTTDATPAPYHAGESQQVTLTDSGNSTLSATSFTLDINNPSKTITYTTADDVGLHTITATATGTFALTNGTVGINVITPAPATTLVVTNVSTMKVNGAGSFTLSTDNPPFGTDAITYTFSSDNGGTFTPNSGTLSKTKLSDTITFTPANIGLTHLTITPSGSPALQPYTFQFTTLPADPVYAQNTENVYELGVNRTFADIASFISYIATKDLVTDKAKVRVLVFDDISVKGTVAPVSTSASYNITFEPAPGRGYVDVATAGIYHYPNAGIQITLAGGDFTVPQGTIVHNFRIRSDDGSRFIFGKYAGTGTGSKSLLQYCRLTSTKAGSTTLVTSGESFTPLDVKDNIFIGQNPGPILNTSDSNGDVIGNTFVGIGNAVGNVQFVVTGLSGGVNNVYSLMQNNAFVDCGPEPFSIPASISSDRWATTRYKNNYTNTAMNPSAVKMATGMTADTVHTFLISTATDLRPADGSPLINAATSLAITTKDSVGANRGYTPDVGALQRTPATTLPIVTKNTQVISGQKLSLSATSLNPVDSGTVLLEADATTPNGALTQGPFPIVVGSGVLTVDIVNIPPGNYKAPVITAVNAGGSATSTGFNNFTIDAITTTANLSDYIGVADSVLATGKPKLPFFGSNVGVGDVTPPTIKLTSSQTNFITNGLLTISPIVSDDTGIDRVEFLKDGVFADSKIIAPYTFTESMDAGQDGVHVYTATAYDISGKSTTSDALTVYVSIPVDTAPVVTVTSITAVGPNADYNDNHFEVLFSQPMDTSEDYDFPGVRHFGIDNHTINGGRWVSGSNNKLILILDQYFPFNAGEASTLTYLKSTIRGWRSAAGVLVESFFDFPITNSLPENTGEVGYDIFTNLPASTVLTNAVWDAKPTQPSGTPNLFWSNTTHFIADGAGNVTFDPAYLIGGGMAATHIRQVGAAIFFKLPSLAACPPGVALGSDFLDTAFGSTHIRSWVTVDGTIHTVYSPTTSGITAMTVPDIAGPALQANQEYCLEVGKVNDRVTTNQYEVRLSLSTNGVRGATLTKAKFYTNDRAFGGVMKFYQPVQAAPSSLVSRVEAVTYDYGANEIPLQFNLTTKARLNQLSGILETGVAPDYAYTGNGNTLDNAPGGVFDKLFTYKLSQDNGVMLTIGSTVDNIHLGLSVSTVAETPSDLVPLKKALASIRASALGGYYDLIVNNKVRAPSKKVIIEQGDKLRIRTMGPQVWFEVKKPTGNWIRLFFLRSPVPSFHHSYLTAQLLLPGNSTVSQLYY